MPKTRVLIVDDSALMRELLTRILSRAHDLTVIGTASDAIRAAEFLKRERPDVITLDVEMPRMDGLTFLERLMDTQPLPVVMISSLTERGSQLAMRALELGAVDVVEKPKLDVAAGTLERADEIVQKVRAAALSRPRRARVAAATGAAKARPARTGGVAYRTTDRIIAVGASTGGTEALAELLSSLPPSAPAVLVVQHMPARFTSAFARRLDGLCRVRVSEAADGAPVIGGHVLVAPGDRQMRLVRSGGKYLVTVRPDPPVNLHRPSVDVLFDSCTAAGSAAVGVILTGMGADGANGLLAMRRAGAHTIAQDEATSVVFGMPKEAISRGAAIEVLPLDRIGAAVMRALS